MIGLTSEITDEVSFGRQDQHLHLVNTDVMFSMGT